MEQSKIIDTLETYQAYPSLIPARLEYVNDKKEFLMRSATWHNFNVILLNFGMNIHIRKIQDKSSY